MEALGPDSGVLYRNDMPGFAVSYRKLAEGQREGLRVKTVKATGATQLDKRMHFVVAGSAGGRVRSAARLVATAAIGAGWWSGQRDGYPITVKSGHGVSEMNISPEEIHYSGIARPDVLVIVSEGGYGKVGPYLAWMTADDTAFVAADLPHPETAAKVITIDPNQSDVRISEAARALAMVSKAVQSSEVVPFELFEESAGEGGFGEKNLEPVAAGVALPAG